MTERSDPYLWLENLKDPRVAKWVSKRNRLTRKLLEPISEQLKNRIRKCYAIPYVLQVRTRPNGHFCLMRDAKNFKLNVTTADGCTEELVNSGDLGKDAVLQQFYVSDAGDRFSFTYSIGGSDEGIFRIMETRTKEVLDELKGMIGDVAWLDKDRYFYGRFFNKGKTPDGIQAPADRIFLRENAKDEMVFGRGIPTSCFISFKSSLGSSQALLTVSQGWTRSDVYAGKLAMPENWRLLYGKGDFVARAIDYVHGKYLVSSFDKQGMGRILTVDEKGETQEIVGEQSYPLQDAVVAENRIVANYLVDASSAIKTFGLNGKSLGEFKLEPKGTVGPLDSDGSRCIFTYQSFFIPYRVHVLENNKLAVLDSREIRGDFQVRDLWVVSKDSTRIHMFKAEKTSKTHGKVLVFGYGGFGFALTPTYFPYVVPFLEDNGTFVITNLRGGTEYGEEWHRKGMREKKQSVFDDFTAALEFFKQKGSRVVAFGISNGGLLVGAALTQHPELIDGALIGYPVLDMRRFHKLFIGKAWVPEYGDPDNPGDLEFLMKYSPYHNITTRKYPPVMIYTGLHDDRVHPAHALKFAARLEEAGADPLLRVETRSGHSGATPTTKAEEYSEIMAFVYRTLKVKMKKAYQKP